MGRSGLFRGGGCQMRETWDWGNMMGGRSKWIREANLKKKKRSIGRGDRREACPIMGSPETYRDIEGLCGGEGKEMLCSHLGSRFHKRKGREGG